MFTDNLSTEIYLLGSYFGDQVISTKAEIEKFHL